MKEGVGKAKTSQREKFEIKADQQLKPGTVIFTKDQPPKKVVVLSECYAPDGTGVESFNTVELQDGQAPSVSQDNIRIERGEIVQTVGRLRGKKDLREIIRV